MNNMTTSSASSDAAAHTPAVKRLRCGAVSEHVVHTDAPRRPGDAGRLAGHAARAGHAVPRAGAGRRGRRQPHPDGRRAARLALHRHRLLGAAGRGGPRGRGRAGPEEPVAPAHEHPRRDCRVRRVRLHHCARHLFVGAAGGARAAAGGLQAEPRAERRRLRQLQHLPGLAHAGRHPPDDALSHARRRGPARAGGAGPAASWSS